MTNNPLLQKYEELYGKKEPPKIIRAENTEVKFELKEEFVEELKKIQSQPSVTVPYTSQNTVATGGTGITKASFPKLTTHDLDDLKASFVAVAERVKNNKAQVSSMSMETDVMSGTKITFEVYVNDY